MRSNLCQISKFYESFLCKGCKRIVTGRKSRKCTGKGSIAQARRQPYENTQLVRHLQQARNGKQREEGAFLQWWRRRRRRTRGGVRGVWGVRLHHLRDQQDGGRVEEEEEAVQGQGADGRDGGDGQASRDCRQIFLRSKLSFELWSGYSAGRTIFQIISYVCEQVYKFTSHIYAFTQRNILTYLVLIIPINHFIVLGNLAELYSSEAFVSSLQTATVGLSD